MTRTFSKIAAALAMLSSTQPAFACGAEPYFGEICYYAFNFCPRNMTALNGSTLPIAQNSALFSLLGTTYGGDGKSTFAVPDLQGRQSVDAGSGPGRWVVALGEKGGAVEALARDTYLRGGADALIVTGFATGEAADLGRAARVRDAVDAPVLLGSGVTSLNLPEARRVADGAIVGTWLKQRGEITNPVDPERARALVERRDALAASTEGAG